MNSTYDSVKKEYETLSIIIESMFKNLCIQNNILCVQTGIVSSYDTNTKKCKVYFLTDLLIEEKYRTESSEYLNLTNTELTKGQKVYIFYKYGDIEQGWILAK